ncbi:MFS transporter [Burkholderia anthina]|uniref:MFS transporter n=1 Tax=Burkholderia anthina TaxID=179879 RepID=UPI001FB8009E|nr:MFS transporter [Burkholderia anthina]
MTIHRAAVTPAAPSGLSGTGPESMPRSDAATPVTPRQLRRAILTSAVGSALEYYDFAIFGLATALVFSHVFFATLDANAGLLASFATYGVGFLARPLGGLFFGSLGDRKGRKLVLLLTIAIMGISTTLVGLLPAGPLGAIGLVVLRLIQGFGAGAEQAGASTLMAEVSPLPRRGFYAALPFVGIFAGFGIATATFSALQHTMDPATLLAWGWRIPFLSSVVLIAVAIWIRLRLRESPAFAALEGERKIAHSPMRLVMRDARRPVIAAVLMRLAEQGGSTIYTTIVIAFLGGAVSTRLGVPPADLTKIGTTCVMIATLASVVTTPMFGALSDRFGRKTVYRWGAIFMLLWALPAWWMIGTGDPLWIAVAMFGGLALGSNSMLGAQCSHFAELFGNRYRYSGVALSREIGAVLSGGLAPILGVYLIGLAGGAYWVMGAYTAVLSALTLVGVALSTETRGRDLTDLRDAIR